jgi:acetylornithine aminotransferase
MASYPIIKSSFFKNAFHGRTSAAVATADNRKLSDSNKHLQQSLLFLPLNQIDLVEAEQKKEMSLVIIELVKVLVD